MTMSDIIKQLRYSLALENEKPEELPDGSDLTMTEDQLPKEIKLADTVPDPRIYEDDEEGQLALESEISIEDKVLERLVANGEILNDIDLALEAYAAANGEMSDTLYKSITSVYNNISDDYKLPALEHLLYKHEGNRSAVTLATEGAVSDGAKDLWTKVVDTIVSLFRRIKDWYLRVWDQAPRLKARAEKIIAVAEKVDQSPTTTTVEVNAIRELGINGKALSNGEFFTKIAEIDKISSKLLTDNAAEYNKLSNDLTTLTKDTIQSAIEKAKKRNDETLSTSRNSVEVPKVTLGQQDKMLSGFISRFERMIRNLNLTKEPERDDPRFKTENTIYKISSVLPGDKMFTAAYPDKNAGIAPDVGKIKYSFGVGVVDVDVKKEKPEQKGDFPVLGLVDTEKVCKMCIHLCELIMDYKRLYVEREKVTDVLLKDLQKLTRDAKDLDATGRREVTSSVNGAVTIHKTMVNGEGKWIKYVMSVIKATLDWCEMSLRQYTRRVEN